MLLTASFKVHAPVEPPSVNSKGATDDVVDAGVVDIALDEIVTAD